MISTPLPLSTRGIAQGLTLEKGIIAARMPLLTEGIHRLAYRGAQGRRGHIITLILYRHDFGQWVSVLHAGGVIVLKIRVYITIRITKCEQVKVKRAPRGNRLQPSCGNYDDRLWATRQPPQHMRGRHIGTCGEWPVGGCSSTLGSQDILLRAEKEKKKESKNSISLRH